MPAFGFAPCAEGAWIPPNPNPNAIPTDHGFWLDPYEFQAYECDEQQDYSTACFDQQDVISDTSSDTDANAVNQGDGYCPHNYAPAFEYSAYASAAHIPNNGIPAYSSIPYSRACPTAAPTFYAYPNAWSSLRPTNPLFPFTWGPPVQPMPSCAQSPCATLAQNHHAYGPTASLQNPAYGATPTLDSPWLQSTPVTDSSHKPMTNSAELTQPQVRNASSDNHIEGSWGGSAKFQDAPFSKPAAQWDEMMTKLSGLSVIGEPAADSSSTIKEDSIHDAENANDLSSKNPNLLTEGKLLLVSIYNMSTLLEKRCPETEGYLDVNMLESTIGLLSRCFSKQSANNSTKVTFNLFRRSQQCIQEPSSKQDVPPCPSALLNKDNVPLAEGALPHYKNEQIVEEALVKSLLYHEHDLGLNAFCHQAGGILEQQTVASTKMGGSLNSPSAQVCDRTLSGAAEESFGKSAEQGEVSELCTSLNGSRDDILGTYEGESHMETMVAFDSDAEDWEYVTSPSARGGCSVFKLLARSS